MAEVDNTDQLVLTNFRQMISRPLIWISILAGTVAAGLILGVTVSPKAGIIAAGFAFLLGLGIAFTQADTEAEESFYDSYAESRSFTRSGTQPGGVTPLLRKGNERRVDEMFQGRLNEEFEGSLALFTYTIKAHDSNDVERPYTLVMMPLPEAAATLPELTVVEQDGLQPLEKLEDALSDEGEGQRVTLESHALHDRFEIFVRNDQDPIPVRRLFSPSFIVWLTNHPINGFAFEVAGGTLCCNVPGYRDSTAGFDEMIAASCELGAKLRREFTE